MKVHVTFYNCDFYKVNDFYSLYNKVHDNYALKCPREKNPKLQCIKLVILLVTILSQCGWTYAKLQPSYCY